MKITSKKTNTSIEFTVELAADDLEPARLKALERLARDVKIPGFRNGKAPANIIEQHVDPNKLAVETLDTAVRTLMPKIFADEKDVRPISLPHIDVKKYVPGEMAEVVITADILPEVKLADYKNLGIAYEQQEISEQDINDVLDRIAANFADAKEVDRAAENGDEVVIDFCGKKDGVAFDGGTAKAYRLRLGSGQFIPGFEDQLVGHKAGEEFNIDLKFPENYGVKELAGAPVVFEIKLKKVETLELPKIDDALAKKTGAFEKLDDLKKDIRSNLEAQTEQNQKENYKNLLLDALIEGSEVEAPASLVEEQYENQKNDILRNLKSQGATLEEALEQSKMDQKQWEAELHTASERRVKGSILMQKLAEELKVKVAKADVEHQIEHMKQAYKKDAHLLAQLDTPEVKADIENRLRVEATLDQLVEFNIASAGTKKASKKPAAKKATAKKSDEAKAKKSPKKSK